MTKEKKKAAKAEAKTTETGKAPRVPSGAAVAGSQNRPVLYPRQLVIMATDAQADWIERMSAATGASKSEVGRALLDAGIAKADGVE